jgi:hypothetical protein
MMLSRGIALILLADAVAAFSPAGRSSASVRIMSLVLCGNLSNSPRESASKIESFQVKHAS